MKTCTSCKTEKEEGDFPWKNTSQGKRQSYCKDCKKVYNARWYQRNKDKQKADAVANTKRYREERYVVVNRYKDVPCTDCGRKFPPVAMDFDHLRDKEHNVSHMVVECRPIEAIIAEIKKCEVVCACCHRLRTASRLGLTDKALLS